MKYKKHTKGFALIELMIIVAIINIMIVLIVPVFRDIKLRAKNASIAMTMSNIDAMVDLSKYPGSLAALCNDFEPGGEFANIKKGVEDQGGIWNCDSNVSNFRIFAKLHSAVVIAQVPILDNFFHTVFAQGTNSHIHGFGNYYCINSNSEKNFTHWSGDNLSYPSCNDADYIPTPVDPVATPVPTPDPNGTPVTPPVEVTGVSCSGGKSAVCHFGKTLCVGSSAVKAHTKHGDTAGNC